MKKRAATTLVILLAVGAGAFGSFRTRWQQCTICGVQQYERALLGVPIERFSEREYDEWGTYAHWKKLHGGMCSHAWVERTSKHPAVKVAVQ